MQEGHVRRVRQRPTAPRAARPSARRASRAPGRGGWRPLRASYDATQPLPSVTSTPSAVSAIEVTFAAGAHVAAAPRPAGRRTPGSRRSTVRHCGRAEDAEHPVVVEEREQVARRVVQRHGGVAGPDRRHQRLHEVPLEVRREAAVGQEPAQRALVLRPREQRPRAAMKARDLGEHPQVAAPSEGAGGRDQPARPSAPAHSRPVPSSRIDIDISDGWVVTPSSANRREQHRVGARVVDDEAGVDRQGREPSCTSWVSACPPSRSSASYSVTCAARAATWAAVSPDTPEPMTAILCTRGDSETCRIGIGTPFGWSACRIHRQFVEV